MSSSPFLLPDHPAVPEVLTDAAVHVLRTHGVDRFSVSALARWMKVTPEAVLNDYSRSRVVEIVTVCYCRRWLQWSTGELWWLRSDPAVPLRLPSTNEERHGVRVLGAVEELAEGERVRGNPLPAEHLVRLRDEETRVLRARLGEMNPREFHTPAPESAVRGLLALIQGLRCHVADYRPRLTAPEAGAVLHDAVTAVANRDPDAPTTDPGRRPPHEPAA